MEVLGGRAHEARPADVDLLDQRVERRVGVGRGPGERIQVHDHEIDHRDAVLRGRVAIGGDRAARQDAAVDHRVQRLDAAVHHLGEAGDVADRR